MRQVCWKERRWGGEFAALKWEFIFSCLFSDNGIVLHQKVFVYSVLQQLAAHYNQNVSELMGYFWHNLPVMSVGRALGDLKAILKELYDESVLPLTDVGIVRSQSDASLEHWILDLFGNTSILFLQGKEVYLEKWLVYLLNEREDCFRSLWKAGRLNDTYLLKLVNRTSSLRNLWLQKVGGKRLSSIYRNLSDAYMAYRSRFTGLGYWGQLGEYITFWLAELTMNKYSALSETEINHFLAEHIRRSAPPGLTMLIEGTLGI